MSANYVKINGQPFDAKVAISDYEENFNVLDGENAGREWKHGQGCHRYIYWA